MNMRFPVVLHTGDGQAYGVTVPDVPGCFSAGKTLDEALYNTRTSIVAHIEILVEDGEEIPVPSRLQVHKDSSDYANGIWAFLDIDLTRFSMKTEKINATLPSRVIRQIDKLVDEKAYKSRSAFLAEAAMRELASGKNENRSK